MSVILKKYKGESATFGFGLPDSYELANMQDVKIYVGSKVYPHVIDNERTVKAKLTSEDTDLLSGRNSVIFHIDDSVFGIRKILVGEFQVDASTDYFKDESVNLGYDVLVMLKVDIDTIEVDSILYNIAKGDSAFTAWQKLPENIGKDLNDYIAYLREPMTLAIEEGNDTAAEWAIVEAERVANEVIREDNEEGRRAAELIREEVKEATIQATEEAIQTNADIQAAEEVRVTAENVRVSWYNSFVEWYSNAVTVIATALSNIATAIGLSNTATQNANTAADLANEKAGEVENVIELSNTASSLANEKAILADTAATNANTVATNVANAEAARVAAGSEVKTNKTSDIESNKTSVDKYPTTKGVVDWAVGKFLSLAQTTAQTIGDTGARLLKLWATNIESTNMPTVGGVSLSTTFAAKTQEAWITPTLLNGATFDATDPLRYRLNQNRRVEFKGKINGIGSGSQVFILPAGYRSSIPSSRPLYLVQGTVSSVAIIQAGYVYIGTGTFDFFGVTFTID